MESLELLESLNCLYKIVRIVRFLSMKNVRFERRELSDHLFSAHDEQVCVLVDDQAQNLNLTSSEFNFCADKERVRMLDNEQNHDLHMKTVKNLNGKMAVRQRKVESDDRGHTCNSSVHRVVQKKADRHIIYRAWEECRRTDTRSF